MYDAYASDGGGYTPVHSHPVGYGAPMASGPGYGARPPHGQGQQGYAPGLGPVPHSAYGRYSSPPPPPPQTGYGPPGPGYGLPGGQGQGQGYDAMGQPQPGYGYTPRRCFVHISLRGRAETTGQNPRATIPLMEVQDPTPVAAAAVEVAEAEGYKEASRRRYKQSKGSPERRHAGNWRRRSRQ